MHTILFIITVVSDLVVTGYNPEMADIVNRTGAIVEPRYFVRATAPTGQRYRSQYFDTEADAWTYWQHFATPADTWPADSPEFGSEAYQCYQEEHAGNLEWYANN